MKHSGALTIVGLIVFAIALAISIGSRLSDQTMTMLIGAVCGAGLTAPLAILGGMYIGAQRASRDRQTTQPQAPIVVMTPPPPQPAGLMLPSWSTYPPAAPSMAIAPRQYTILGEETVIDGTDHLR